MTKYLIILSMSFVFACSSETSRFRSIVEKYPTIPNREETPGHLCTTKNPDFKEYRYSEKIPYCQRNVNTDRKKFIYDNYKIAENERNQYTIDHLVPLSIGGSNEIKNLWPEHKNVKAERPTLEVDTYKALEAGEITQKDAIEIILNAKFHNI